MLSDLTGLCGNEIGRIEFDGYHCFRRSSLSLCSKDRQLIFKEKLLNNVQVKVIRKLEKGNRFGNKNTIDNKINLSFVL